ncbi:dipeptide transport system permease protein DppC [Roseibium sp. TrichSKD4]|uniref:ABC transporter permease n=1 Tax=Roseibium sp. TrichSKD4 TaxID=744980 RepID=UPI0001E5708C|nr:ABC transporter permease subunit [Roseibium sp. TrichSKD4]EFO31197.1 dipeptide transport system permease protein DppC [Roseibium sp. TrichSKD4]
MTSIETGHDHLQPQSKPSRTTINRRFKRSTLLMPLAVAAIWCSALMLTPYDPNATNFLLRLSPPSSEHWFGTDQLGRDVATRVLYGGLWSIGLALVITSVGAVIGTIIGLTAGHFGRAADVVLMRVSDSFFAFPELIAAVTIAGLLGPSTSNMVFALIAVSWMKYARLVRSLSVSISNKDYVLQARLNGLPPALILSRHILPNVLPNLLVLWTNGWSRSILSISGLSFLGFGVQPPNAEWGAMLLDGKTYMQTAPHLMIFPGLAILFAVLAINLTGDRLRDRLDGR